MIFLKAAPTFSLKFAVVLTLMIVASLLAQDIDLKQEAIAAFKDGNCLKAIRLLKQAVKENPHDAEIYYYLGRYTHYYCYDSRPVVGYSEEQSDEILKYLEKAIELNPKLGNAYYFIGAEHGLRFLRAMHRGDVKKMRTELKLGRKKGGYPDWLMQHARNTFKSCEQNAILFIGGDAEYCPMQYLQLIDGYRRDITVIPINALNRPWYVMRLKSGFKGVLKSIPISWSEEQILNVRPYKWKKSEIILTIPNDVLQKYNLAPEDSILVWELAPDLTSPRGEKLSGRRALLANIVETNNWKRPIYFTIGCHTSYLAGLEKFVQLTGLVFKLMPMNTEAPDLSLNPKQIESILLDPETYKYIDDAKEHHMPRASNLFVFNYRAIFINLALHYSQQGNKEKAKQVIDKMNSYLQEDKFPIDTGMKKVLGGIRQDIKKK